MKLISLALLALATPLVVSTHAAEVVARVGDQAITADQIKPVLTSLAPAERETLAKNPALLSQSVRTLIIQQVLFKEATAAGWDKNPDVAAQIERVRQAALAESYLESVAKVPENYPSENEVQAFYESRKDTLALPRQLRLAQIFIAAPESDKTASEKAKSRVAEIAKSLKGGADFAELARTSSEERESATRGGDLGWLAETTIRPEIRSKVSTLAKGATTEPVKLDDGWYLVRVLDIAEPRTATLEEVRDRIVTVLRAERARQNREAYLARIQQQNPIALDELGLANLLKP